MQLGTRWTAGEEPPAAVPPALRAGVAAVEKATFTGDMPDGFSSGGRPRWTLTFLEGKPIAELDTGVIVSLDDDGVAVVRHDTDDEFA